MQKARRHPITETPTACRRTVSGSFHSLSQGSFHLSFTVLVHYRSSGSIQPCQMVLAYSDRVSPAPPYSVRQISIRLQDFHLLWSGFPTAFCSPHLTYWAPPLSLATTHGITIVLFSSRYLDVSVPRVLSSCEVLCLQHSGLPHSDIYGSRFVCNSPQLFAAYHVFRRLQKPRHPPYALIRFLKCLFFFSL